jgi:hypothetical protein
VKAFSNHFLTSGTDYPARAADNIDASVAD